MVYYCNNQYKENLVENGFAENRENLLTLIIICLLNGIYGTPIISLLQLHLLHLHESFSIPLEPFGCLVQWGPLIGAQKALFSHSAGTMAAIFHQVKEAK